MAYIVKIALLLLLCAIECLQNPEISLRKPSKHEDRREERRMERSTGSNKQNAS